MFEPAYLELYESGELKRRAEAALDLLSQCSLCPNGCAVDRMEGERDVCKTGRRAGVSSAFPHFGEEHCLRGTDGSGTIFFTQCNLRCVFCQNHDISHESHGKEVSANILAGLMLELQKFGCHNVNFVTPSHVVPQILEALLPAVEGGLRLPLVYNSSGYDSLETLQLLEGVVDIYMPDFKFWKNGSSEIYTNAPDYADIAKASVTEMHRQVGDLVLDENGIALRGLLLRHLVMPGAADETRGIMRFIANEISKDTSVNLMPQYRPAGEASMYPELSKPLSITEYREAEKTARDAGIHRFV